MARPCPWSVSQQQGRLLHPFLSVGRSLTALRQLLSSSCRRAECVAARQAANCELCEGSGGSWQCHLSH